MPYASKKLATWSLLAATLCACATLRAQSHAARISTFKLDGYGWRPLPKSQRDERPGTGGRLVAIDHKGRILVGFAARNDSDLATREQPKLSFRILRFTPEGKLDISLVARTTDYFANGLYLGPNDEILARANENLQMLTEEEADWPTPPWKMLAPCSTNCRIHQSPSRRTLIVSEFQDAPGQSTPWATDDSSYTIFDFSTRNARPARTCRQMANYAEKITDEFAYWPDYDRDDDRTVRFHFCDVQNPQEVLPPHSGGGFFPLSDDVFLLLNVPFGNSLGEVKLVRSGGQVTLRRKLARNDTPQYYGSPWAISDEKGDRFAFVVDTWRGGSRFLDISGKLIARRIVVYSETGTELASVPLSRTFHRDFDFSLSPDGHLLAILDQNVMTVVQLE